VPWPKDRGVQTCSDMYAGGVGAKLHAFLTLAVNGVLPFVYRRLDGLCSW
jgi:hypothetical protein